MLYLSLIQKTWPICKTILVQASSLKASFYGTGSGRVHEGRSFNYELVLECVRAFLPESLLSTVIFFPKIHFYYTETHAPSIYIPVTWNPPICGAQCGAVKCSARSMEEFFFFF